MITLWRIFQAGCRNFLRNAWLSTAATAVMTVTLTIMLTSLIATRALNDNIKLIINKINVAIYLKDETTPQQTADIQSGLSRLDNVASVKFVSKAEALQRFRQQTKDDKSITSAISEEDNPLPASLEIKAKDPNKLEPIKDYIDQAKVKPLVLKSSYEGSNKAVIDKIIRASNVIKKIGIVASLLFVTISVLIIFNTIRMAIFTRREEIEIMKLVGATNWFIRGPFLFEAALYGLIAAIAATALCYTILLIGGPKLTYIEVGPTIELFRSSLILAIVGEIIIGVGMGMASSLLAMVRYLKL